MRKSSIELLRIFLFVMVVAIHACGPYLDANHLSGTLNWQAANLFDGASRVAVDCFALITGYFMCTKKTGAFKNLKKLLLPLAFYVIFYFPLFLHDYTTVPKSILMLFRGLVTLDYYFYHFWYIFLTIIIYLLSPYLNIIIEYIEKGMYKKLLLILFVLVSIIPTIIYLTDFYDIDLLTFYSKASLFVLLYFIGAYIRKYPVREIYTKRLVLLFIACEVLIVSLSWLYNSRFSPMIFIKKLAGINITYPFGGFLGVFYEYNNILIIAGATLLLLAFLNFDFQNRLVNKISSLTYGAYLGHVFFITIVSRFFDPMDYQNTHLYIPVVILFVLCVSVCSLTFEYIRQVFSKFLFKNYKKSDIISTAEVFKERDVL